MTGNTCILSTDAGIHALWAPEPFAHVHDHNTWDTELGEDPDTQRHHSREPRPHPHRLFVILINPAKPKIHYRTSITTFDLPE
jgi:hypothetical protein